MTTLLTIVGLIYIVEAFRVESLNPFTVLKQCARDLGITVGATPKAIKTTREMARELKLESQVEIAEAGLETSLKYSAGKNLGERWANRTFDPMINKSQENQEKLETRIKEIKANRA